MTDQSPEEFCALRLAQVESDALFVAIQRQEDDRDAIDRGVTVAAVVTPSKSNTPDSLMNVARHASKG